jgi:hypothetical protein
MTGVAGQTLRHIVAAVVVAAAAAVVVVVEAVCSLMYCFCNNLQRCW